MKLYQKYLVILLLILVGFIAYFYLQNKQNFVNRVHTVLLNILNNKIKNEKSKAFNFAYSLSQNEKLKQAILEKNTTQGYDILKQYMNTLETFNGSKIHAQIVLTDFIIFARSWDNIYAGMPLGDYRTDLDYFKTHKTPRTSIEIGRRLGIKATVPIYDEVGLLLGFVEVISFFESLTEFFSSIGIDLYVLMNEKHLDIAVLMRDNLVIDEYVVANRTYSHTHVGTLKALDFKELKSGRILHKDDKYIFYETMTTGDSRTIGAYLFVLPQKYLEYFRNPDDDISFLINVTRSSLVNVVKEEHYKADIYDKHTLASLLYFKDVVAKEDKQALLDEAYVKLDEYSKDELIQLVLDKKIIKKIDGKIK